MKKIFFSKKARSGQMLLEAIIALSVLTVGFLGLFTLLSQSFGLNRVVSDNYVGTYLAAEGIEIVRNISDNAWSLGNDPLKGTCGDPVNFSCVKGADIGVTAGLNNFYDSYLRLSNGVYSYSGGGVETPFKRRLDITYDDTYHYLKVLSTVTWTGRGGIQNKVVLEEKLYGWRNP